MPVRWLSVSICAAVAWAWTAAPIAAQGRAAIEKVNRGAVRIVYDGTGRSRVTDTAVIVDLMGTLDEENKLRVLPILGRGGASTLRDVLFLRGVDFGIVNADVLSDGKLRQLYPSAVAKLRYVADLYDQTIYLIGRNELRSVDQLKGGLVLAPVADGDEDVTARVLLDLLGIKAKIAHAEPGDAAKMVASGEAAALILLARRASDLPRSVVEKTGLKLMALPARKAVLKVYQKAIVKASQLPQLVDGDRVETLKVARVLAVFNWQSSNPRHANAVNFVKAFYGGLGRLAETGQSDVWRGVRADAQVLGWQRFGPAGGLAKAVATAAPGEDGGDGVAATRAASAAAAAGNVKVLTGRLLPFSDQSLPGGGMITEILLNGLAQLGGRFQGRDAVQVTWINDRSVHLSPLLEDQAFDVAYPWIKPKCEQASALPDRARTLCERFLFSDAVFQVLNVFFAKKGTAFTFNSDREVLGKSVCAAKDADVSDLDAGGRKWVAEQKITLLRPGTVNECFQLAAEGVVDAVYVNEFTGRAALTGLGIGGDFSVLERPVSIAGLHIIAARANPQANVLIGSINRALGSLKESKEYDEIVAKHLDLFWRTQSVE